MTQLDFRAAKSADLPFLVALMIEGAVVQSGDDPARANEPEYEAALAAIAADPNQALYLAEAEGERVGTFQLTFIPGIMRHGAWRGLIEAVFVASAHRNRGYGSQMLAFAIARCRERRCSLVQLTSNKARMDAHRFYRRLGFAQSHEGFKLYL